MTDTTDAPERDTLPTILGRLSRLFPALLTVAALVLAVQAQQRFDPINPATLRGGMLRFGAAVLLLLLARFQLRYPAATDASTRSAPPQAMDIAALARQLPAARVGATALGLAILAIVLLGLSRADAAPEGTPFLFYFLGWLTAITLIAGAWLRWPALSRAQLRGWLRTHRGEVIIFGSLTLLAATLRLVNLETVLYTINGDEASIGLEVQRVLAGEIRHPFALMWGSHSSLVAFVLALPARVVGLSVGSLRLMHALICTLAIPALYLLARPIAGRDGAAVATLFLATLPMHLHYSRVSVGAGIWDSFFFTATFAAFVWALRREESGWGLFVLTGILSGLGQYSYTGSRLLPLVLLAVVGFMVLVQPAQLRARWPGLVAMALVFLVVASPHYLYGLRHANDFNARLNDVGILQNGWLTNEMQNRGQGALPILWDQFRRALFGLAFFPDQTETWAPGTPLLATLLSLALFLGLVVSLRRWRDPAIALLHACFWGILLTGGMLTVAPPSSNRLVGLTPVACLLAALGWQTVARALAPLAPKPERQHEARIAILFLLALATSYTGLRAHQRYLAGNLYGGNNARAASYIGRSLAAMPPDTTLLLATGPRFDSSISPLLFLAPTHPRRDLPNPFAALPDDLPASGDLLFVFTPERALEIPLVQQAFPTATPREVRAADTDEVLYIEVLVDR